MKLYDRFAAAARKWPDGIAIEQGSTVLTYRETAARVQAAAGWLGERLKPGDRVALNLVKSPDAIVLMLAALAARLAYVPIDPSAPPARRAFILADSDARLLIVDQTTAPGWDLGALNTTDVLAALVADAGDLFRHQPERTSRIPFGDEPVSDDAFAYLLYTSGSTGNPKGVAITQGNAEAFVDWAVDYTALHPGDRVAVHAPLHFDLPVLDVYAGLGSGATLCPVDEVTALFPQALVGFLREQRITALYAVPSALNALLHRATLSDGGLPDLRLLLYAGEEFYPGPLRDLMNALPGTEVHNLYGPIETNVVTAMRIEPEHLAAPRIPIGYPVAGTRIFLHDRGTLITEPGRTGELLVSGPSVTPGYLGRPDLTRQARMIVHDGGTAWVCHRTGDYATWGPGGVLNFLGRRDGLVKTRGYRVELGDVEAALLRHPGVREAAVLALPHPEHTSLLHAFVLTGGTDPPGKAALQQWCLGQLPSYMAPAQVTVATHFPRTSTGKIARRELAAQLGAGEASQ